MMVPEPTHSGPQRPREGRPWEEGETPGGESHGEAGQLKAGAGLRDTVGLGHEEFRKQIVKWKRERKKSVPLGIQLSNYLKFVCLTKC